MRIASDASANGSPHVERAKRCLGWWSAQRRWQGEPFPARLQPPITARTSPRAPMACRSFISIRWNRGSAARHSRSSGENRSAGKIAQVAGLRQFSQELGNVCCDLSCIGDRNEHREGADRDNENGTGILAALDRGRGSGGQGSERPLACGTHHSEQPILAESHELGEWSGVETVRHSRIALHVLSRIQPRALDERHRECLAVALQRQTRPLPGLRR